jgi:hypothetical protein
MWVKFWEQERGYDRISWLWIGKSRIRKLSTVQSLIIIAIYMASAKVSIYIYIYIYIYIKVKWSRYRSGVAQRVSRGIALLFHVRGTRRGWVVSSTTWPQFTPGKDPVPILQEAGWAPGAVWTGGKSRPHRDSIPNRPASSQSLYRLNYPAQYV